MTSNQSKFFIIKYSDAITECNWYDYQCLCEYNCVSEYVFI